MERIICLFGALLMSAGIIILLGINPEMITQPITARLSDIRIVNAELRNMLISPRREHIMMVFILLANYPILYFLNADWFDVLMNTFVGQLVNCIVAVVVLVTVVLAYQYTQPIQYRR